MPFLQRFCIMCGEEGKPPCYGYVQYDETGSRTYYCKDHLCSNQHNPKDCLFSSKEVTSGLCDPCLKKAMDALRERRRKRQ